MIIFFYIFFAFTIDISDVLSRILKGRRPIPVFSSVLKYPEKSGTLYYIG